jgi:hypothetical protein
LSISGFLVLGFSDNKKGPEEAPCTPPVFGMALAIPGGAPGYDDNKEFGNNIAHMGGRVSKDCSIYTGLSSNVKANGMLCVASRLTKSWAFGEWEFLFA